MTTLFITPSNKDKIARDLEAAIPDTEDVDSLQSQLYTIWTTQTSRQCNSPQQHGVDENENIAIPSFIVLTAQIAARVKCYIETQLLKQEGDDKEQKFQYNFDQIPALYSNALKSTEFIDDDTTPDYHIDASSQTSLCLTAAQALLQNCFSHFDNIATENHHHVSKKDKKHHKKNKKHTKQQQQQHVLTHSQLRLLVSVAHALYFDHSSSFLQLLALKDELARSDLCDSLQQLEKEVKSLSQDHEEIAHLVKLKQDKQQQKQKEQQPDDQQQKGQQHNDVNETQNNEKYNIPNNTTMTPAINYEHNSYLYDNIAKHLSIISTQIGALKNHLAFVKGELESDLHHDDDHDTPTQGENIEENAMRDDIDGNDVDTRSNNNSTTMTDDDAGVEIVAPVHISQIDDDTSTVGSTTSVTDTARVVTDIDVDLYGNMDDEKDDKDTEAKGAIPILELSNDDSIIKTAPKVVMGDGKNKNIPLVEEPSDDEAQARSSTSTNVIVEEPTSSNHNNTMDDDDDADHIQTDNISSQSSTGAKIEEQHDDEVNDNNAVMTDDVIINESLPQQEFPTTATRQESINDKDENVQVSKNNDEDNKDDVKKGNDDQMVDSTTTTTTTTSQSTEMSSDGTEEEEEEEEEEESEVLQHHAQHSSPQDVPLQQHPMRLQKSARTLQLDTEAMNKLQSLQKRADSIGTDLLLNQNIMNTNLKQWYKPLLQRFIEQHPTMKAEIDNEQNTAGHTNIQNILFIDRPVEKIQLFPECSQLKYPTLEDVNGEEDEYHHNLLEFAKEHEMLHEQLISIKSTQEQQQSDNDNTILTHRFIPLNWSYTDVIRMYLDVEQTNRKVYLLAEDIMKLLFTIDSISSQDDEIRALRRSLVTKINRLLDLCELLKKYYRNYSNLLQPLYKFCRTIELACKIQQQKDKKQSDDNQTQNAQDSTPNQDDGNNNKDKKNKKNKNKKTTTTTTKKTQHQTIPTSTTTEMEDNSDMSDNDDDDDEKRDVVDDEDNDNDISRKSKLSPPTLNKQVSKQAIDKIDPSALRYGLKWYNGLESLSPYYQLEMVESANDYTIRGYIPNVFADSIKGQLQQRQINNDEDDYGYHPFFYGQPRRRAPQHQNVLKLELLCLPTRAQEEAMENKLEELVTREQRELQQRYQYELQRVRQNPYASLLGGRMMIPAEPKIDQYKIQQMLKQLCQGKFGRFTKDIVLPADVDVDNIKIHYNENLISIELPKMHRNSPHPRDLNPHMRYSNKAQHQQQYVQQPQQQQQIPSYLPTSNMRSRYPQQQSLHPRYAQQMNPFGDSFGFF